MTSNPVRVTILSVTIPLFHVNISLNITCNATSSSEIYNACENISFDDVIALVDNVFSELLNTSNTVVPVLSNYSVISENQITLFLQVFSRNITYFGKGIRSTTLSFEIT